MRKKRLYLLSLLLFTIGVATAVTLVFTALAPIMAVTVALVGNHLLQKLQDPPKEP